MNIYFYLFCSLIDFINKTLNESKSMHITFYNSGFMLPHTTIKKQSYLSFSLAHNTTRFTKFSNTQLKVKRYEFQSNQLFSDQNFVRIYVTESSEHFFRTLHIFFPFFQDSYFFLQSFASK